MTLLQIFNVIPNRHCCSCRSELSYDSIASQEHPEGRPITGRKGLQRVYVVCRKCKYENSAEALGFPEFKDKKDEVDNLRTQAYIDGLKVLSNIYPTEEDFMRAAKDLRKLLQYKW